VEHALRLGYLQLGDQLPRVKDVVGSLSINPNTVIKAYADLEGNGIAVGRPGQGTFIISVPETIAMSQLDTLRRSLKRSWLRAAKEAGLDENAMVALFMRTLQEFMAEQVTSTGSDVDQSEVVA
jgi:GntR family transcriptional regulator